MQKAQEAAQLIQKQMTEAQAIKEMSASGLKHVETIKALPWQHVMLFEKPK